MTTRERLHHLLDELPEEDLPAVERFLSEPDLRALLLSPESEPSLSAEEREGILEAKREAEEDRAYKRSLNAI
ncbi:MAG: hypothetical protein NTZ05_01305 [Chloroflexi bacterium]|nr:hypothetical protein [Chloroflexota bacterium]